MVSVVSLGQGIQFLAPGISYHSPMLISLIPVDISGSNHLNSSISGWGIRISSPLFKRVGKLHQVLSNPLFRAYKKLEIFKADFRRTIWQFVEKVIEARLKMEECTMSSYVATSPQLLYLTGL